MPAEWWIAVVGTGAALCTTLAFVPQIAKIWRQGGRDLSYAMLMAYWVGVLLWLGYGLLTGARAVIAANAAAALLVSLALGLKRLLERRTPPAASRPRIAIDMDEVLADSMGKHLRVYNQTFGTQLAATHLDGRALEACIPEGRAAAARELVLEPSFFRDLEVIGAAREVVRELAEHYEVFVASAAMEVPTSFAAKYAWLREHFPFIPPSHIVFCGDKAVLDADYLIDDTPRHFERFRGTPILFGAPHNRGETRYTRVTGWAEVRRLFLEASAGGPSAEPDGLAARAASRPRLRSSWASFQRGAGKRPNTGAFGRSTAAAINCKSSVSMTAPPSNGAAAVCRGVFQHPASPSASCGRSSARRRRTGCGRRPS